MAPHRYWRIYITANNGSEYTAIGELELRASPFGIDQTPTGSGVASSSTNHSSGPPAQAFDNITDEATKAWVSTSSGLPQWLQYDFGAGNDVEVYEIEMWAQDGLVDRAPVTFDVQYSDDGVSWTTAWSEASVSGWVSGTPKVFTRSGFPGISYGYWRIRITDNNGDALTAAGELEFRDAAGVAQQATGGRPVFSSQYATSGANSAASAFDDDIGTEWVSESGVALPHFIGYAFGETREPVEVYLVAQNNDIGADRSPRDIEIQYSEDGSTWETFDSHTDLTFAAGEAKTFGLNWTVLPDTPTLSLVGSPTESTQEVEGTAFSESEDGVSFAQAQYQAATDEGFSTIVYDETSGDPPENGHTLSGLGDNREHWARVRYQNDQDEWSEWSNVVSFTTLEIVPFSGPKLCSLVLEVYKEDGETIAWEVGTDPSHENPFLSVPSNYAAQELDIIAGAATVGQVEVLVIDKSQTPGDQDSGWMTERIANEELRDRRCRLRRFINETVGYVTIADGPAGVVRMHSSYSGYQWVIRDTRETERNVVAFSNPSNWALLPPGLNEDVGWGELPDGSFLVPPIAGPVSADVAHGATAMDDGSTAIAFINIDPADIVMTQPMLDGAIFEPNGSYRVPADGRGVAGVFPDAIVRWRYAGEGSEDWREIVAPAWSGGNLDGLLPDGPGLILSASGGDVPADVGETVTRVRIGIRPGEELPTESPVELLVLYSGPVSERFPYSITGKTTGELLTEIYEGIHSPKDPETGAIVPTGIRYVEAGLDMMVDPVTFRLTDEVDDARSWTEQKLYAPTGWAPTLDLDLAIYPSSQVVPDDFVGLPEISLANAEPSPDWDAGEFIINVLEFTYPRYFVVEDDAEVESIDRLAMREVKMTFRSGSSVGRREEKASFDGSAFAAVGGPGGTSLGADEYGASLAADRRLYVFDRYNKGAQAIALPVRRVDSALWRNGQWVVVDASWLPDYVTKRRGALWGGQIMSIGDLNCAWRIVLVEEAVPLERPPES